MLILPPKVPMEFVRQQPFEQFAQHVEPQQTCPAGQQVTPPQHEVPGGQQFWPQAWLGVQQPWKRQTSSDAQQCLPGTPVELAQQVVPEGQQTVAPSGSERQQNSP
jgi:hypothetical protein